jgi:hypothetical protein
MREMDMMPSWVNQARWLFATTVFASVRALELFDQLSLLNLLW